VSLPRFGRLTIFMLAAAGCVSFEDPAVATTWETQLVPERDFPGVSGQAAAVSRVDGTAVGIAIDGAEPGAAHAWALRRGTCAVPDVRIGPDTDYPELAVDATGSASVETHLGPRLSLDQSYHIEVRVSAADDARVACGDLAGR
jgi:hypothetical protein